MKRMTKAQWVTLKRYLEASDCPRLSFVQLILETGMRVSESLPIRLADISEDGKVTVQPLKGSNGRHIPLSNNLLTKLRAMSPSKSKPLISQISASETGSSQRRLLYRYVRQATREALGQSFGPHALRHTLFSLLYSETKDLILVQQWAGHRSINSTMKYMHLDLVDQANQAVGALIALSPSAEA